MAVKQAVDRIKVNFSLSKIGIPVDQQVAGSSPSGDEGTWITSFLWPHCLYYSALLLVWSFALVCRRERGSYGPGQEVTRFCFYCLESNHMAPTTKEPGKCSLTCVVRKKRKWV